MIEDNTGLSLISKSVAVVEDNIDFGLLLKHFLCAKGYKVCLFDNSFEFLHQNCTSFDAIVVDLFMPDPDGIAVIRQLAQYQYTGAIILMSGEDESVLRAALALSKAQALENVISLSKPFSLEKLLVMLEAALALKTKKLPHLHAHWHPNLDEILAAIHSHQMQLYYQPKIKLNDNTLVGFEALIRWHHPEYGVIAPDYFIPLAEQSKSVMHALTTEVIRIAIMQLATWQAVGKQVYISINVSMLNLVSLDFPQWLQQQMLQHHLLPEQLHLEVTETALMSEVASSLDILLRLKMKGFVLSIDDFGTGYSSLSQLHKIPFGELKIDKSFVMALLQDNESKAIVETCIFLGKRLHLNVVAEGVENHHVLQQLIAMGCDVGQGFVWSKAVTADEASKWLATL